MLFKGDYQTKPIETVKSSIINAAIKNHWSICEAGPQELRADLIYKKCKIFILIEVLTFRRNMHLLI